MAKSYLKCLTLGACVLLFCSLTSCVPLVIAGAGAGMVVYNTAASNLSLHDQLQDSEIKSKAYDLVQDNHDLYFSSNIDIAVFNRIVLLLGQVPDDQSRSHIAQAISKLAGVRSVYDQLIVAPPDGYWQYATDALTTARVKSAFVGHVDPAHFNVISSNGVVYLMALTTPTEGVAAARIASEIGGVRHVFKAYSYLPPQHSQQLASH